MSGLKSVMYLDEYEFTLSVNGLSVSISFKRELVEDHISVVERELLNGLFSAKITAEHILPNLYKL